MHCPAISGRLTPNFSRLIVLYGSCGRDDQDCRRNLVHVRGMTDVCNGVVKDGKGRILEQELIGW